MCGEDRSKAQKMSILERAQGLEWPQFFVDIRHDASHQVLMLFGEKLPDTSNHIHINTYIII